MKHIIITFMIAVIVVTVPAVVVAQDNVVPDQPTTDQNEGIVTTRTSDWLWLIPVIGIPLLLYALAQSQRVDDKTMSGSDRLAGSKGGEAARRRDRDDLMDEDE